MKFNFTRFVIGVIMIVVSMAEMGDPEFTDVLTNGMYVWGIGVLLVGMSVLRE